MIYDWGMKILNGQLTMRLLQATLYAELEHIDTLKLNGATASWL
jgi:hypothetical protein